MDFGEYQGIPSLWQEDIVREVETGAAAKVFDLSLSQLGPYSLDFTRSGKHVALAGRKGHIAIMDWKEARLITELQVCPKAVLILFDYDRYSHRLKGIYKCFCEPDVRAD